ncbi:enoyl-CoA hydratase/isomerase family protein [Pyruvatibacter sp.]|uniref:enoyl-CoA hydratase/isomerase family protein n=1 Tax=Pyruvatibacter sp. TaxID=1981328 RepID=UPI0032EB6E09
MSTDEILFEVKGAAGVVRLNRPKALNALTLTMVRALHPQLVQWADDPAIERVIVKGEGDRAFCAGGDIRALYDWGTSGNALAVGFYEEEYKLNTLIKEYPKPYIALMDGITMGGGVGLSVHGSHRVVTERLKFAMPETGIGLFPDVGGTYFLPRTPGCMGMFMSLTGARLNAADALVAGIATQYVDSVRLDALMDDLCAAGADVDRVLAHYRDLSEDTGEAPIAAMQRQIDALFAGGSVEDILAALDADGSEWAANQAATIRTKSPTSLKVAHRQMVVGVRADFRTCMATEFRIVSRIMTQRDFYEGVRATIIDKDGAPNWQPDTLEAVTRADVDAIFAPLPGGDIELG